MLGYKSPFIVTFNVLECLCNKLVLIINKIIVAIQNCNLCDLCEEQYFVNILSCVCDSENIVTDAEIPLAIAFLKL